MKSKCDKIIAVHWYITYNMVLLKATRKKETHEDKDQIKSTVC